MMPLIKNLLGRRNLLPLAILYTILVTVALLYPTTGVPQFNIPFLDKLVHVLIHWLLTFIWLSYFFLSDRYHFSSKMVVLVLFTCFFYGIVVEAFQRWFTLTRTFDIFDIAANGLGDLTGLLSFWIIKKKIIRKS